MTAPTTTPQAQQYLAEVEAALADLPADERAELLDDLAMHLVAVEEEGDGRSLSARLGASADYAAELRAAAGLPARGTTDLSRRTDLHRRLRDGWSAATRQPWVREVLAFLPTLRPAWWVLRGYLVVLIPSLRSVNGTRDFPVPAPWGSHLVGTAAVLVAVVASVALGRRRLPRTAVVLVVIANAALGVAALHVAQTARGRLSADRFTAIVEPALTAPDAFPLTSVHGPITQIYPYAADGTPLQGVLLYDQDGRPLRSSAQHWWPDSCHRVISPVRAADGGLVTFSYPHAYVLADATEGSSCSAAVGRPAVPLPVFGPTAAVAPRPAAAPEALARP